MLVLDVLQMGQDVCLSVRALVLLLCLKLLLLQVLLTARAALPLS